MKLKIIVGGLVMSVWLALVVMHLTPVESFVDALKSILMGLGIYHVTVKDKP